MKHTVKLFVLLAAVLCCLTACEKNPESSDKQRDITYTVAPVGTQRAASAADKTVTVHLATEAEWQALLDRFCYWAEEGNTVTFYRPGTQPSRLHAGGTPAHPTKDATTFSTTDREAMKRWMAEMEDEGMTVTVTYNSNTGTWNGTAYATAPSVGSGTATYVNSDFNGNGQGLNVIVTIDSANSTAYVNFDSENYLLHMPCGVFHDIYEEDGRLVLLVWNNDTLYIGRNYEDSLMICFAYSGFCPTIHTHECYLVPAPQDLQTWYCSSPYDIILGLFPHAIETYPEIGLAQICATAATEINCVAPFWTGTCEMQRYFTDRTDVDWELSLRYTYNNDSSYYIVDSLGVTNYPDNARFALPMVIHDLHQYPGCASQYVFHRIN